MLLSKNHYNRDFYLPSSREPLRIVNQEKDLGVIFDDKLSFCIHITEQVNKANRIMAAIRRSFTDLNSDNLRNLFTTIHPHLEYAAAVWSPHMKDIQLIANVQQRATKQLPKISKLPYSERLRQLDLPTPRYRRIRSDMIEVFKILKYYDSDPNQILQRHTSSATRGHSLKLAKKQSNSNLRLYSFSIRVINNLNNLSNYVVSSANINTFKSKTDLTEYIILEISPS